MSENKQLRMKAIGQDFSVCKVKDYSQIDLGQPFVFTGSTDEEKSLVCSTAIVPQNTVERDDGWKALRIIGILDFSLIGILARISSVLAENRIGIFAISTFNTDYIFVKKKMILTNPSRRWKMQDSVLERIDYQGLVHAR